MQSLISCLLILQEKKELILVTFVVNVQYIYSEKWVNHTIRDSLTLNMMRY